MRFLRILECMYIFVCWMSYTDRFQQIPVFSPYKETFWSDQIPNTTVFHLVSIIVVFRTSLHTARTNEPGRRSRGRRSIWRVLKACEVFFLIFFFLFWACVFFMFLLLMLLLFFMNLNFRFVKTACLGLFLLGLSALRYYQLMKWCFDCLRVL